MKKPMPKRPHAQIHLPSLTPEEALLLANIFDRASDAIWRAHGEDMVQFLGIHMPQDEDNLPPQDDLPFQL